jgi:hypothetical protein
MSDWQIIVVGVLGWVVYGTLFVVGLYGWVLS